MGYGKFGRGAKVKNFVRAIAPSPGGAGCPGIGGPPRSRPGRHGARPGQQAGQQQSGKRQAGKRRGSESGSGSCIRPSHLLGQRVARVNHTNVTRERIKRGRNRVEHGTLRRRLPIT